MNFPICRCEFSDFALWGSRRAVNSAAAPHFSEFSPSLGVHCYMGMTYWGVTSLKFVTGTHKLAQQYINPKTKRACTGVGSKE